MFKGQTKIVNKKKTEKYLYFGAAVILCATLAVGMLSLMVNTKRNERKTAKIGGEIISTQTESTGENIRVVLKTNGFQDIFHQKISVSSESGILVSVGGESFEYGPEEMIEIHPENEWFQKGNIVIHPKESGKLLISSLKRGYGVPSYRGILELYSTASGIVAVNELLLEEYLYAVVPSEMPSSYELEALKAQAVCARSYAARQMETYSYPEYEAHVDDSTKFQVYGNSEEKNNTVKAVDETKGQKVWYNNNIIPTYYFSTSGGNTTTSEAWGSQKSDENAYLKAVSVSDGGKDYEEKLPWYRWTANIEESTLSELIRRNTNQDIGQIENIEVTKRGDGDVAIQVVAMGSNGNVTIDTENKIRKALGGNGYTLEKQDGTVVDSKELLPSAFFDIEKQDHTYVIRGGGFGHGIGMSQNAANEMAKAGKTYKEILQFFYHGIELK